MKLALPVTHGIPGTWQWKKLFKIVTRLNENQKTISKNKRILGKKHLPFLDSKLTFRGDFQLVDLCMVCQGRVEAAKATKTHTRVRKNLVVSMGS